VDVDDRFPIEERRLARGELPTDILATRSSYTIDGERLLNLGGRDPVIGLGSAVHLPPLVEHCLENTGKGSMRVHGVSHPSGDPAPRAYESDEISADQRRRKDA
jgi:hypothetical protein